MSPLISIGNFTNHFSDELRGPTSIKAPDENCLFDKVVVVEVYSSFTDISLEDPVVEHEILANVEAGENLARKFHPLQRYIWSNNEAVTNEIGRRRFQTSTMNLVDNFNVDNPLKLTARSKVFIVAQGNFKNNMIADLEDEAFIEMLEEDLGISNIAELEFVVCRLGKVGSYLNKISEFFRSHQSNTKMIAYPTLLSVNSEGELIGFRDTRHNMQVYQRDALQKIRKCIFPLNNT